MNGTARGRDRGDMDGYMEEYVIRLIIDRYYGLIIFVDNKLVI